MSHRLANEFSQTDKFIEKIVDTQSSFASQNASISLGETRALRAFSTSWKLFWKIDRWCHLNFNWSFLQKRFEPFEFLVHSLLVPTLVSCWCVELFTWVWFSRVLFAFFNRSFHVYNIAVFTNKFTKTAWKIFILSFIPLAKSNFELLVFTLYYYLELLPETQWVPGIKFKEKINECLCERPFEKGNAVVVGRRGEGVCFELTFLRGRGGCTRMALSTSNLKCWKLVRYFLLNTWRTPFHVLFVWSEVTYRCLWKKALKFRQFYFKQANEYPHLRLDSLNVWKYKVRLYLDEDYFIIDLVLNPSDRFQSSPAQLRQHGLGVPPMGTMHLLFHSASPRPGE